MQDLALARKEHETEADGVPGWGLECIRDLANGMFPAEEAPEEWPAFDPNLRLDSQVIQVEIGGIPVSIQYPKGTLEQLCGDYFRHCNATSLSPLCHISAQRSESEWAIFVNGQFFMPLQNEAQLGLGLMHAARSLLYQLGDYDIAFHAAMVAQGDCGLLLCAPRESGKSTLAAYLVAQGFDLLADEPALLHLDSWSVDSLRVPISLKQGSWPFLQAKWKQLADAPIHVRSDGTRIRLIYPSERSNAPQSRRLTHIVLPQYNPSSEPCAERLSPLRALALLNEGGMLFAKRCSRESFEAFLHSICCTPAFRLSYSSLAEAHRMLCEIS
jgi:hypothetical protein